MTGRKCGLCEGVGHNMTTCVDLMFHQNKAHCEYLDIWQMWIQTVLFSNLSSQELVRYQYNYIILQPPEVNNLTIMMRWLRNKLRFRLLRSFLNLSGRGTDKEIAAYIHGLYHYLLAKRYNIYENFASVYGINTASYQHYDYLLETIPIIPFHKERKYGITLKQKPNPNDHSLETCAICYEDYTSVQFVKTNCSHSFCATCVIGTIQILPNNKPLSCAMCRSTITQLSCYASETNKKIKNALNL